MIKNYVTEIDIKEKADEIRKNLFPLCILNSKNPEQKKALERLDEIRLELEDIFEILCPNM